MARVPGSDDRRIDARMVQRPGNRESGHVDASRARFLGEAGQPAIDVVALELTIRLGTQRHARPFRIDAGRAIFAREPAAGERAECLVEDAVLAAERYQLLLVARLEQRERVLEQRRPAERERGLQVGHASMLLAPTYVTLPTRTTSSSACSVSSSGVSGSGS